MTERLAAIVLAAGEGSRMRSARTPKVLFGFAGRSLLGHVLAALPDAHPMVVVGHRRDEVIAHLQQVAPHAIPVVQAEQRGTGHAVRIALESMTDDAQTVLVVPADAPLLHRPTLEALIEAHLDAKAAATLLTSVVADPSGYGRVIRSSRGVERVVEHRDATADEREVDEVATSVYAFDAAALREALSRVRTDNVQGEEYLTDVVALMVADGLTVHACPAPALETAGVNDRVQLAAAHRAYNDRLVRAHQLAGVTVVDPATTWIDAAVRLAADVTLWPDVDLHGATVIEADAQIGPQVSVTDSGVGANSRITRSVLVGARIGADCEIGPFAYLRPGTDLAAGVKIGTYVEVKNAEIGEGSKVPHLSYVGDASIGEHTNIGAASVFVNYDGVEKHRTRIGSHARTGADNMFVAPVEVGDGAYTAAGSVIAADVPAGALGVSRAPQRNVTGWVVRKRPGTAAAAAAERAGQDDATNDDATNDDATNEEAPDDHAREEPDEREQPTA